MLYQPMTINPGGTLDITDVVGRDQHVARYWKVLKRQSLVLSAERRIGKTHIIKKMHEEGHKGFVTFYQDLEKVHTIPELVRALYDTVDDRLPRLTKAKHKAIELWSKIVPDRRGQIALPTAKENWKDLVTGAFEDVLDVFREDGAIVVFLWDELPLMLYNLVRGHGPDDAIQLLDLLRSIRHSHSSTLRFVFTGSIGLHLVLADLRRKGNANDATNDMLQEVVPPLSPPDAMTLTIRLLASLGPSPQDPAPLADQIVEQVGGFPYYIHHVVDRLDTYPQPIALGDVDSAIDDIVHGDLDPAHMSWYAERIPLYYDDASASLAFHILDVLAKARKPLQKNDLINLVRHQHPESRDEAIHAVCATLRRDHYLTQHSSAQGPTLSFRWPLVKRWWSENR